MQFGTQVNFINTGIGVGGIIKSGCDICAVISLIYVDFTIKDGILCLFLVFDGGVYWIRDVDMMRFMRSFGRRAG